MKYILTLIIVVNQSALWASDVQLATKQLKELRTLACKKNSEEFAERVMGQDSSVNQELLDTAKVMIDNGDFCKFKFEHLYLIPEKNTGRVTIKKNRARAQWDFFISNGKLYLIDPYLPQDDESEFVTEDPHEKGMQEEIAKRINDIKQAVCSGRVKDAAAQFNNEFQNEFDYRLDEGTAATAWTKFIKELKKGEGSKYCKLTFQHLQDSTEVLVKFGNAQQFEMWKRPMQPMDTRFLRHVVYPVE